MTAGARVAQTAHGGELPDVEIVSRADLDPDTTNEWTATHERRPEGGRLRDHRPDEIFDPDGVFDVLSDLDEDDLLATVKPIEIPGLAELSPAGNGGGDAEPAEGGSHTTGVDAVLERLQAADEAAAAGAPVPLRASKKRLGEILVDMGLVTEEQIENGLARQKDTLKRLGQLLLEDKTITELDLTRALATKFGIEYLDLTKTQLDMAAAVCCRKGSAGATAPSRCGSSTTARCRSP